jgi:hypothetical protein
MDMATDYDEVATDYSSDIDITLQRVITPVTQRKIRRVVESITLLRRLYDINTLVYRAARDAWLEDFLDVCNLLDSSGVSAMVAKHARFLLSQGFSFASAVQPDGFIPSSVPEARDFAKIIQDFAEILKKEWGVPDDKYNQFWPYIDQSVQKLFGSTPPMPVDQLFLIEPAVRRVFSMLDQEDAFEEWQHLKFNWKVFAQDSLLLLGGLAGPALAVPGGIVVAAGIVVPPIALLGGGALLLVAGCAVKAQ